MQGPGPALDPDDVRVRAQHQAESSLPGTGGLNITLGLSELGLSFKGKYPIFDGKKLRGMMNRTMTLRRDSDVSVRHGVVELRDTPLSPDQLRQVYSQTPRSSAQPDRAPVVWFVSHCNDFNGR